MKISKTIHSERDLPKWFSLESYKKMEQFTATDWACEIAKRLCDIKKFGNGLNSNEGAHWWMIERASGPIWEVGYYHPDYYKFEQKTRRVYGRCIGKYHAGTVSIFGPYIPKNQSEYSLEEQERFKKIINEKLKKERELLNLVEPYYFHVISAPHKLLPLHNKNVALASNKRVYGALLNKEDKEEISKCFYTIKDHDGMLHLLYKNNPEDVCKSFNITKEEVESDLANYKKCLKYMEKPYNEGASLLIEINSSASDEQLIIEFNNLLEQLRSDKNRIKNTYTESKFSKWRSYHILAYFDLNYWAKLEGIKITHAAIMRIFFPNEEIKCFKTRVDRQDKLCKEVFSIDTVRVLAAQAGVYSPI